MSAQRDEIIALFTEYLRGNEPFAEAVYDTARAIFAKRPWIANALLPSGWVAVERAVLIQARSVLNTALLDTTADLVKPERQSVLKGKIELLTNALSAAPSGPDPAKEQERGKYKPTYAREGDRMMTEAEQTKYVADKMREALNEADDDVASKD